MSKVISYCLWGNDDLYCKGALKNIELAKIFYPEFICRFYVAKDLNKSLIKQLDKNAEVVVSDQIGSPQMMMDRFLPIGEDVNIFLSRDTDSRIGIREQYAVNEWILSNAKLHTIHDHPEHNVPMLGGMWGLKNKKIDIQKLIYEFKNSSNFQDKKGVDQFFLWDYIYPLFLKSEIMKHDEFFGGIKINIKRNSDPYTYFIGECIKIDEEGRDIALPLNDIMRKYQ